jgi:hypothetical protein
MRFERYGFLAWKHLPNSPAGTGILLFLCSHPRLCPVVS